MCYITRTLSAPSFLASPAPRHSGIQRRTWTLDSTGYPSFFYRCTTFSGLR
ncbi:hypothetical protein AG1IA_03593 [Rhizoctonia solani AG-1 IA]|uniref:Uncharacterized protein n=1 Tax=Thanatephorus cucumeris (strain AG1-IA) TaxID=983506 RepID=L8X035_THACA|nr:hypothetical protein AG1IA_03593 [Rhizoctonia solani AG-1 IA]